MACQWCCDISINYFNLLNLERLHAYVSWPAEFHEHFFSSIFYQLSFQQHENTKTVTCSDTQIWQKKGFFNEKKKISGWVKASDMHFNILLTTSKRISETASLRLSCLARLVEENLCFILMKSVQIWKADRDQVFYLILCFVFDHSLSVAGTGHLSNIHGGSSLIYGVQKRHRSLIRPFLCEKNFF